MATGRERRDTRFSPSSGPAPPRRKKERRDGTGVGEARRHRARREEGRVFEAFVLAKSKGRLEIEPIQRGITYTTASAREVVCHWAKRGRRRKPGRTERGGGADERKA
jgi:hypothetical protein